MERKKIKIVRIINRFNIGGPTFNATFLTRFLDERFETILIGGVPDEGEKDSLHILEQYNVTPIIIPELQRNPNIQSDRKAYKKLKSIIELERPDIVHTHASKAGLLGRRVAAACGVKVIVHTFHGHVFHSYFGKLKTNAIKMIERNLAKKSSGIIAISELQKNELVHEHKICQADKVEVIPLGFDLEKFSIDKEEKRKEVREAYDIADDEVALAIVGRLAPIKDHAFFLEVVTTVLERNLDQKIKVFIVGDGSERPFIEQRVEEINNRFGKVVFMTSWVLDIARFNQGMDIMCLTSKNEGTPVSLIEAQASGLPVVSTDVGGVRDVVKDEASGYVVACGNKEAFAQKLEILIVNQKIRSKFADYGQLWVNDKFHYSRLVKNMANYYIKILNNNELV